MSTIKETTLHPDGNEGVDLYPKTNINQVQELPQKLSDIDNSILNVNNSKLTKPTNPSAESAVTMLADGTVGTKLLSEIGSSEKFYVHNCSVVLTKSGINFDSSYITFLSEKGTSFASPADIPVNTLVCGGYVSIFSDNKYLYYAPMAEPFDYPGKTISFIRGTDLVNECNISQILFDYVTEL